MSAPTFVWYNHSDGSSSDYAWLPGHWISDQQPPGEGSMFYQDVFGGQMVAGDFAPQAPMKRLPEYLVGEEGLLLDDCDNMFLPIYDLLVLSSLQQKPTPPKKDPFGDCLLACKKLGNQLADECQNNYDKCMKEAKEPPQKCAEALSNCLMGVGSILAGCIALCHDQAGQPIPPPKTGNSLKDAILSRTWPEIVGGWKGDYEECLKNKNPKIPGLPTPPKKK